MLSIDIKVAITVLLVVVTYLHYAVDSHMTRHKRNWIIASFSIEEEYPGPFPYQLGTINLERENGLRFKLRGKGVDEDPKGILGFDETTRSVIVYGSIDYEEHEALNLTIEAIIDATNVKYAQLGIEIIILNINDNPPRFQWEHYETTIKESMVQGQHLITVSATDADNYKTQTSNISYYIASVTPNTEDIEFNISRKGTISFRGCLDYEQTKKYTIIVGAKDYDKERRLSSSTTVVLNVEDENDHLPTFLRPKETVVVKERDEGVTILRIKVNDTDTKFTPAWKAKYIIKGDKDRHFNITTDPETNDGILTVVRALDFESKNGNELRLSITVRNEVDYFSCTVKQKRTVKNEERWDVEMRRQAARSEEEVPSLALTVFVEDINDPPEFTTRIITSHVEENKIGFFLGSFTAVDRDGTFANQFVYQIGIDPAGWVTVDKQTGAIKTIKGVDRESKYVVNNTYSVILYAIDKGSSPMTGTGTLIIHIRDENDNVPFLRKTNIDMCSGAGATNITPYDLDEDPFSGPFRIQLVNEKDLEGKWRLDPTHGSSVNLIRESSVFSGVYKVSLKIFDKQEQYSVQNLTVTVCDCVSSGPPNCSFRKSPAAQMGGSAIGIIFVVLFLFLGSLVLAILISCVRMPVTIIVDKTSETLLKYNTEMPGSDCIVSPLSLANMNSVNNTRLTVKHNQGSCISEQNLKNIVYQRNLNHQSTIDHKHFSKYSSESWQHFHDKAKVPNRTEQVQYTHAKGGCVQNSTRISYQGSQYSQINSTMSTETKKSNHFIRTEEVRAIINERMLLLQSNGNELHDYPPHIYADEGQPMSDPDLDAISIDEKEFVSDLLHNLGPKFKDLATMCSKRQNN